jgi:Sulfatase
MKCIRKGGLVFALCLMVLGLTATPPASAQAKKPNILVIMGDDIGITNIGVYSHGMMAGKTPNLDKLAKEGMLLTDYYAEASCTAGRANFIMGELPIRRVMRPASSARTILVTRMNSCPPSTASMNSSAICITWTPWKTRSTRTIRRIF